MDVLSEQTEPNYLEDSEIRMPGVVKDLMAFFEADLTAIGKFGVSSCVGVYFQVDQNRRSSSPIFIN